ncbi:MAG: hypothetical protein ACYS6W_06955 [Planctomycetota bacterium]|jgi:hypothetical protein
MAVTASKMLPLGTSALDFSLPDTKGNIVSLGDFKQAPALSTEQKPSVGCNIKWKQGNEPEYAK